MARLDANLRMIAGAFYMAFASIVAYCRYKVRHLCGIQTGDLLTDYCLAVLFCCLAGLFCCFLVLLRP